MVDRSVCLFGTDFLFSAPWKCDGLVEISSVYELAENDKISSLLGNSFRIFTNSTVNSVRLIQPGGPWIFGPLR